MSDAVRTGEEFCCLEKIMLPAPLVGMSMSLTTHIVVRPRATSLEARAKIHSGMGSTVWYHAHVSSWLYLVVLHAFNR